MAAPPPSSPPNDPTTPTTTSNNHTPTTNSTTPTTNSAPRKAKSRSMLVPRHSPHRAREAHARRARGALRSSGGASPSTTTTTTTTASGNKPSALSVSLSASSMRHRGASPSHRPYLGRSGTVGVPGATARKTHKKHPSGSNSATLRLRSTFHPEPSPIAFLTRNSPGGHSFSTSSLLRSVDSEQSYEGEDDEGAPRVTGTGEWDLSRHRAVSQPVRSATLPSGQLSIPDLADTLQLDRRTSVADLIVQADDDRSRGRARVGSPLHRSGSRPGSAPGEDEPNPLGHVRESSREDVMYEPSISQNTSMETSVDGGGEFLSSDEDTDDDEPIVADPRANQTPSPTAAVGGRSAFTAVSPGPDATPTSPMLGHHRRVSVKVTPLGKQRALSADRVASPRKELFPDAAPADADAVPKSGSAEELALAAAFSTILGSTVKAELEDVAGAADTPKRTTTRRAAVPMFTGRNRGRSRSLIFHDRPSPYEKVQDAEDPAVVQAQLRAEERAAYEKAYQLALNKLLEAVQPPPVFPLGQLRTVKVGMLLKKDNTRNSWRSRIFALEGPYLYYYAHRRDPEPRGVLCLNSCVVKHEKTISQQRGVNCFSLTAYRGWNLKRERDYKLRSYFFASDSYADMSEWMSILSLTGAWYSLPSREPPARVRRAYFARRSMFLASSNVSS